MLWNKGAREPSLTGGLSGFTCCTCQVHNDRDAVVHTAGSTPFRPLPTFFHTRVVFYLYPTFPAMMPLLLKSLFLDGLTQTVPFSVLGLNPGKYLCPLAVCRLATTKNSPSEILSCSLTTITTVWYNETGFCRDKHKKKQQQQTSQHLHCALCATLKLYRSPSTIWIVNFQKLHCCWTNEAGRLSSA